MKLRVTVSVWTLLVLSALTESKEQCDVTCERESLPSITKTTTSIDTFPHENCTVLVRNKTSESHSTVGLTPGTIYQLFFQCFNCCLNVSTEPEAVTSLMASATTSSLLVGWTEPKGNWLHYTVSWSNGTSMMYDAVNHTSKNITDLTAGVRYHIRVTAVADDGVTEGKSAHLHQYTKPDVVQNLTVMSTTTTEISLNWVSPSSHVFQYNVGWHCGGSPLVRFTRDTSAVLTELIPGTEYTVAVTAVAGDNRTEGKPKTILSLTNPEEVRNVTVTDFTTSSVSLEWLKPEGNVSFYRVQWMNESVEASLPVNDTYITISELTPGVQYNFTVIAVAGDKETSGEAKQQHTLPSMVRNLHITEVMTSSLTVRWTKPEGHADYYTIQWINAEEETFANSTRETSFSLEDLTAGSQHIISVAAGVNGLEKRGTGSTLTTFTRPGKPTNIEVTERGTEHLRINWTLPEGRVDHYQVNISNTLKDQYVPTALLTRLKPGRMFHVTVTAVAGNFTNMSDPALVATSPTPPGSILIGWRSNSSLQINWTTPAMMENVSYISYIITYQPEGGEVQTKNSTENNSELSSLMSGASYNVTIQTVGAHNLQSSAVRGLFFTLPNPVSSLAALTRSSTSVTVTWSYPLGVQSYYEYSIQTFNATGGLVDSTTVSGNSTDVSNLKPGSRYDIGVTTIAAPGSESTVKRTFSFTSPEPVSNITAIGSTTNLSVSWSLVAGLVASYSVLLYRDEQLVKNNTDLSNLTSRTQFVGLNPGVDYCVMLTTKSGPLESNSSLVCNATFPNPPGFITVESQTTNSINFTWAFPEDMDHKQYNFSVSRLNVSSLTANNWFLLDNLQSGSPHWISVVTVGVREYESQEVTAQHFTNYKPSYSYLVMALYHGVLVHNDTSQVETYAFNSLQAGTLYCFHVFTVVGGVKSTLESIERSTSPEPLSNITAIGSTTNLSVSWSLVAGLVASYSVLLYRDQQLVKNNTDLSNLTSRTQFVGLNPGVDYCVMVTTKSGPLESNSSLVCNATFPNPPGFITVESQTTNSINFTWAFPEDMDHKQYNFSVSRLNVSSLTANNWFLLDNLQSGSLHWISVVTVGVREYESQEVTAQNYTRPEPVSNITAIGSTTNLSVSWSLVAGLVASYSVLLYRDEQLVKNNTDLSNLTSQTQFVGLNPGVDYCVMLTTKSGPPESNSSLVCNATFPNPPGFITVESQTTNSINFTWAFPEDMDHKQYNFSVSRLNVSSLTANNWFLLDNLQSGSLHWISVVTVGVREYESQEVTAQNFTRPYSVINLQQTEITASTVTLTWDQPEPKASYLYLVQFANYSTTVSTTNTTITELESGSNFSFTVTTQTADGTPADPVTVSNITRPYGVSQLEAETLNTTAVRLRWMKPLQYKSHYRYWIETTGCGFQYQHVTDETTEVSELLPGTNCTFCVSVEAANIIKGEEKCTSQYTKPETVQPTVSNLNSNSSMLVLWTPPQGTVGYFLVYLNSSFTGWNNSLSLSSGEVDRNRTFFLFNGLAAGTLYSAMLTTFSGPFNASSAYIDNATYPNSPGPVEILAQTTTSIETRWTEALLMTDARYRLTHKPALGGNITIYTTTNTSHTFDFLPSGTSFDISVSTVGALDLESEPVFRNMISTRPLSVASLMTTADERSVAVVWTKADDYKESYRYTLSWQRSNEAIEKNITISETEFRIAELNPGSSYDFSVTTETFDGTQAETRWISNCTRASPVTGLECEGPNKAEAEVVLSWHEPSGQSSGFQISINGSEMITSIDTCCNYTVSSLHHHTQYQVIVQTESCGQPGKAVSRQCWTGITNPPIPPTYESKVTVSDNQAHNKFSLWIDTSLINSTNGPVTHVGVLITDSNLDESLDLRKYLGKTYNDWKAKSTPAYLATVADTDSIPRPRSRSRRSSNDLIMEIGAGDSWNGYYNGPLKGSTKYQCAVALFTDLTLKDDLVDSKKSLVSITQFAFTANLPVDPVYIGWSVGATLGIFCVFFIVLVGFIIYWKRHNKESSDIEIHSLRPKVSMPVRVEEYETYFRKQKADSNCGFAEEYEDLKLVGTAQSKTHALTLENKHKNRYNNVLPYDSSRVKLSIISGSPNDDYINANYMPGFNSRMEFIAAQGPLPTTVNAFWRMIWEKNVQTVVMLTHCNEQGRVKCEQYWSPGTKHFEDIIVTTTSEIPLEDWTIRDFRVKNVKTAETRSICHFHFTAWPDHGVPEATELLISFRHLVREHMNQYSRHSPTVVHCSAGVGRTGTFIAVDHVTFQIERENIVDAYGIVYNLRMHRPLMVQTEDQYVFLNQCALDIIRSRTGTNVDLIYQNIAALPIYENIQPKLGFQKAAP